MATCTPPAVIQRVAPAWPKNVDASPNGPDVKASIRVVLSNDGSVAQASILETTGIPLFDDSAIAAVKQFQFQALRSGCASKPYNADVTFFGLPVPQPYAPCNHDALVLLAVTPEYPEQAGRDGIVGPVETHVLVAVRSDGSIRKTTVTKSSGSRALDRAALHAASLSTYAPKFVNCHAADNGEFLFRVTFDPN
jgi:TonB family protein